VYHLREVCVVIYAFCTRYFVSDTHETETEDTNPHLSLLPTLAIFASLSVSGVPDKASITLNFRGVDHKERLMSGFDHYAADIFLTLTAEGDCVQHGGFDYIESACRRTGDLGHKWWWRGDSSTYVASIRPTFGEPLMQAEKWEVCLGVGRNDSPHPYRIQGAIALHNVKSNEGELRRP